MPNRLIHETSPYLQQHAYNPVDWHPWGPEALTLARDAGRPILLSVGYSACHWCHVMERESFEDADIAAQMNRDFVNIKVDREERPDVDELYMRAVQAFTGGHGGWPMTVFLTPDGRPYFGGTYFPPVPRHGMPSFPQVLGHAARLWREHRGEVARVGDELAEHLAAGGRLPRPADSLDPGWLDAVATACDDSFDEQDAGFGGAPKFPPSGSLAVLLAHHHRTGDARSLEMVTRTLDAMARGGMYDLLGGGFARYSVDAEWRVPHFEKMLYDNGQLVPVYLDAWKLTGNAHYRRVVVETLDYVLREMTLPGGGLCASQDADSEGEEGRFFAWTPAQVREILGVMDGLRACALLQVTDAGTFEHGTSVLRMDRPLEALDEDDRALLIRALPRLQEARLQRVPPGRDDKVITAWNGLMIGALARSGAALGEPRYLDAAAAAARFLLDTVTVDGRLHRSWKDGRVGAPGFLDDHANLLSALLDLFEATGAPDWLTGALDLADRTVALFWDERDGGLFYAGHDAEALVARSKNLLGGALPSGNGVAALAFTRLDALCGRADLGEKADRVLRSYQLLLGRAPRALGPEALAGAWRTGAGQEVGVAPNDPALRQAVHQRYLPFAVLSMGADPRVPWMEGRGPRAGLPTAYVCEHGTCRLPVTAPSDLLAQLDEVTAPRRRAPRRPARVHAPALPADPARWLNAAEPLTLDRLRGNVVVLDFWTYCCINCMHLLPELAAVEERFADDPVVVIGVHSAKFTAEQQRESVARALARHDVHHPVVLDSDHEIWQEYAIRAWPTVTVLDPTGRIAWQQSGEVDRDTLGRVIARTLEEARAAGTLGEQAWEPVVHTPTLTALSHPGKVATWPDATAQSRGVEPFGPHARLYVSDSGQHRVIEASLALGPDGWPRAEVLRIFGVGLPGLVDGAAPRFRNPQGLARDEDTLWVADTENHAIRAIDLHTGEVRTAAGTGQLGRGRAPQSRDPLRIPLRSPWGLTQAEGVLFIAMAGTHQIWIFNPSAGQIGPIVGSGEEHHVDGPADRAALAQPSGLVLMGRYLFWVDSETSSVRMFDFSTRQVATVCGQGLFDFGDVDGVGDAVRMQHPLGVTAADGQLYVADTFNNKIKRIDLSGGATVSTLAGGHPDRMCEPGGLALAGRFLIVADTNNHRLVSVDRQTGKSRELELEGM
ncbi:MAG: DUF255 domain-containing protein [Alphaproteobacteria bacterium]|nr:DUF255 domain-containing protein [Alphaproteobacteria bacterium]